MFAAAITLATVLETVVAVAGATAAVAVVVRETRQHAYNTEAARLAAEKARWEAEKAKAEAE